MSSQTIFPLSLLVYQTQPIFLTTSSSSDGCTVLSLFSGCTALTVVVPIREPHLARV